MATPTKIIQDLQRARYWHSDLVEKKLQDMATGCTTCGSDILKCLHNIIKGLKFRIDLGIFDDTTLKLHSDMMELMGPVQMPSGPIVDAGPPVTIQQPTDTAFLPGTVTAGDS